MTDQWTVQMGKMTFCIVAGSVVVHNVEVGSATVGSARWMEYWLPMDKVRAESNQMMADVAVQNAELVAMTFCFWVWKAKAQAEFAEVARARRAVMLVVTEIVS